MQSIKRVALSSPDSSYPDGKSRYVISQMFTQFGGHTGEVKLYEYDRESSSSKLVAHATDLPGLKTIAWSNHPSYECLLACGTTQGKIHIVDLNSNTLRNYHPSNFDASQVNSADSTRRTSSTTSSSSTILGTLNLPTNRACVQVVWSAIDPSVVIGGFDKVKQQASLCIWDLEVSLQGGGFDVGNGVAGRSRNAGAIGPGGVNGTRVAKVDKLRPYPFTEEDYRRPNIDYLNPDPPAHTSDGSRRRPLQQYLPGECVNSVSPFTHTNTLVLAGTSSKAIKCIDLRVPGASAQGANTGGQNSNSGESTGLGNLAFSLPTRAIYNLCTSTLYPHLFASCEDGLSGAVKIWDTRFLRSGTDHPGLFNFDINNNNSNNSLLSDPCSYDSGRGGVVALRWDQRESGRGGQRLGIGTKEGGVILYDVLSGETVDTTRDDREGEGGGVGSEFGRSGSRRGGRSGGAKWTTLAGVKNTQTTSDAVLQTFAFLPPRDSGRSSVLSIFRDNKNTVEETGLSPLVASGRMGDASVALNSSMTLISPSEQVPLLPAAITPPLPGTTSSSGATPPLPRGRTRSQRGSQRTTLNVRNLSLNRNAMMDTNIVPNQTLVEQTRTRPTGQGGPLTWQRTPEGGGGMQGPSLQAAQAYLNEKTGTISPSPVPVPEDSADFDWSDIIGMDIGEAMRRKAMLDFGLELSSNDAIETKIPTTNGFLFEWLDRFIRLMGLPEMRSVDGYDFTLQGVYGIWNGRPAAPSQSASAERDAGSDSFLYSKAVAARAAASRGSRAPDNATDPEYIRAMETIIRQRPDEFLDTVLPVETSRRTHRRFMLAICGELTGARLEAEISRISQTQLTKAAWIALVNTQRDRAIRMLKQSDSDTHRMLSSFLQQGRIDQAVAKELRLSDPYMRAMVNYLAGGASWELTINDRDLPLLDRTVLAIRFVNDSALSAFLENQTKIAQQHGSLQGIPLTGLGEAGLEVISRYVDITGDIQVAAILGSTTRRPTTQVTRWIEDYRDMLDGWKLYRARVMFDMSRGNIARWYGDEIRTPKQVVVRCNFCQKNITSGGAREQTVQSKTRTMGCPTCHNRLPRCIVCLLQIDMVPPDGPAHQTLESAFVFCQTCHHGGHYQHIMEWFYGTGDEAGPNPHDICAVSGCDCHCSALR